MKGALARTELPSVPIVFSDLVLAFQTSLWQHTIQDVHTFLTSTCYSNQGEMQQTLFLRQIYFSVLRRRIKHNYHMLFTLFHHFILLFSVCIYIYT